MFENDSKGYLLGSHRMNTKSSSNSSLKWREEVKVTYRVEEIPPLMVTLFLGFQHYISMAIATLTIPILLAPAICLNDDHVGLSEITGTLFVASGLITLLQTFFGIRLPIVQAGTYALLVPTLSYLSLPQWECPSNIVHKDFNTTGLNESYIITGSPEHRELWMSRLREIQGCILIAAIFEVVVGLTGVIGWMMKFIGPLTICPTVTLLGLSLFKSAPAMSSKYWPVAFVVLVLMVIFSQLCGNVKVPCFIYSKEQKCHTQKFHIFKMFAIVLSIAIAWLLCYILTITDYFPSNPLTYGYHARTDLRISSIQQAPWFRLPYPGQWGRPTASISGILAIFSGVLVTMIESVGDYYSCAKLSGAPPPPIHAINRGILIEGLGSMLDGLFGTGNGTTSTSINVGVVGITKVGSRVVVQVSAFIMIVFGLFIKVGALFLSIPDPIIGGTFFILFGMIVAIGLSNLQHVNMNSSRNLFILGSSLLFGLAIPEWVISSSAVIQTDNTILLVLLKTQMFIGGMVGFVLDNTIPGSRKTRGMEYWDKLRESSIQAHNNNLNNNNGDLGLHKSIDSLQNRLSKTYDLPLVTKFLSRFEFLRKIPFCPSYRGFLVGKGCCEGSECCRNSLFKKIKKVFKAVNVACNKDEDEEEHELEDIEMIVEDNNYNLTLVNLHNNDNNKSDGKDINLQNCMNDTNPTTEIPKDESRIDFSAIYGNQSSEDYVTTTSKFHVSTL